MDTFFLYLSLFFISYSLLSLFNKFNINFVVKGRQFSRLDLIAKFKLKSYLGVIISILPILIILTYRYQVGTDWKTYSIMYNDFLNYNYKGDLEIGERFLMTLSNSLNLGFNGFLFFNAFLGIGITSCILFNEINKKVRTFSILIYLFLYFGSACNIMTQITALSFVLLAYQEIIEKKWIKYLIFLGIAYLFHAASIFLIPLYWIYNLDKKFRKRYLVFLIIAFITIVFIEPSILQKLLTLFGISRYAKFFTLNRIYTFLIFLIVKIPLYSIEIVKRKSLMKSVPNSKSLSFHYLLILLEVSSYILGINLTWVGRLSYFFSIGHTFILSSIVLHSKDRKERIYWSFILILYFIIYFFYLHFIARFDGISTYEGNIDFITRN